MIENGEYVIGDVVEELERLESGSVSLVQLDDAWARPMRNGAFGVEYPTHGIEQTKEIVDVCRDVLEDGGWLVADCDDWLLPRLCDYIREEWGDAAETYESGFRKIGGVTLVSSSGGPDRSTPGMYGSSGGYPVLFAHKGETDRRWSESVRQIAKRPRERYGWGSVKPTSPYEKWIEAITEPGELVAIPCAGTAPGAIASEMLGREWVAIDIEEDARRAFSRRFEDETSSGQTGLDTYDG